MQNSEDLLRSPQGEALLKNKEAVLSMMNSPDAQRLLSLLEQSGDLNTAAQSAQGGDLTALTRMLQNVLQSREGAAAAEQLRKQLPGN